MSEEDEGRFTSRRQFLKASGKLIRGLGIVGAAAAVGALLPETASASTN